MIEGTVNAAREAVVRLTLQGPTGQEREVEAVIDTGYSGFLTTSPALVSEWGLAHRGQNYAALADGSEVVFGFYVIHMAGLASASAVKGRRLSCLTCDGEQPIQKRFWRITGTLGAGEDIEFAAKTHRDLFILTNRRIIQTDTQGLFNKKTEYHSLRYAISRWTTRGRGWKDGADLKIWVGSMDGPLIDVELQKDESGQAIATVLASHAL